MKYLMMLTLLVSITYAQTDIPVKFLEKLEDQWVLQKDPGGTVETWEKKDENFYEGFALTTTRPESSHLDAESLTLFKAHSTWYYMAHPSQNKYPTLFTLVEANDTTALFINDEHDYPQQIRYTFTGTDSLIAEISLINNKNLRKFGFKKSTVKDD